MRKKKYRYKVTLSVMNRVGALTRITIVFRKFGVNIYEFRGKKDSKDDDRFTMRLWVSSTHPLSEHIFRKVGALVDVVTAQWKQIS